MYATNLSPFARPENVIVYRLYTSKEENSLIYSSYTGYKLSRNHLLYIILLTNWEKYS